MILIDELGIAINGICYMLKVLLRALLVDLARWFSAMRGISKLSFLFLNMHTANIHSRLIHLISTLIEMHYCKSIQSGQFPGSGNISQRSSYTRMLIKRYGRPVLVQLYG